MGKIYAVLWLMLLSFSGFNSLYAQNKYVQDPAFNAAFQTNKFFIDGKMGIDFSVPQPDGKILVIYRTYGIVVGGESYNMVRINPDNTADTGFTTAAFDKEVKSVVLQPDGKIIIAGAFNLHNNAATNYIIRLNTDGSRDTTFNPGTFAFQQNVVKKILRKVVLQADGKILVAGNISAYAGMAHNSMVRLNPDGSTDTSFHASTQFQSDFYYFDLQPNGKIVAVDSDSYPIRLNSDGSNDPSFHVYTPGTFSKIRNLTIRNDGKIYLAGKGTFFSGTQYLVRLNADGYYDNTFSTNSFYLNFPPDSTSNGVYALLVQPDGKLLVGGNFSSYGGQPVAGIMRLNDDATLDTTFQGKVTHLINGYSYQDHIDHLSFHPSGNVIASGSIKYYNQDYAGNIVMFNPSSGSRITSFQNICKGFDKAAERIFIQPDGKIIVTGWFHSYNGVATDKIVRLNPDGSVDTSFAFPTSTYFYAQSVPKEIKFSADGKIFLGTYGSIGTDESRGALLRLNSNGSLDSSYFSTVGNDIGLVGSLLGNNFILFNDGRVLTPKMIGYLSNSTGFVSITKILSLLNADGTLNTTGNYTDPYLGYVSKMKLLPDGKVLVTGSDSGSGNATIKRMLTNGQVDNTFTTVTSQPSIWDIFPAANGKIYAVSNLLSGHTLMRFNTDGTLDNTFVIQTFNDGMATQYAALEFENNGKFFTGQPEAANPKRLTRHNENGTYDTTFDIGTGFQSYTGRFYTDIVADIKKQGNGILVAGALRSFDGQPVNGLARLVPQETLDAKEQYRSVKDILIHPNPTTGILHVKAEGYSRYEVTDAAGRTVVRSAKVQPVIDVSHLAAGLYYLILKGEKETSVQKFIKKQN